MSKEKIKTTKILLFILKIIPFMPIDEKIEFYEDIKKYYAIENNENYKKLVNYYEKYWLRNNYINFEILKNEELINRTNNYVESFHHPLNSELDVFHPKFSYLIDKYKIFIIKSFNKVKESIINPMPVKIEKFSVVKDILDFFAKYKKQYKGKLDLSKIL